MAWTGTRAQGSAFTRIAAGTVLGMAVLAGTGCDNIDVQELIDEAIGLDAGTAVPRRHAPALDSYGHGQAAIVDLGGAPKDFSAGINHITALTKEARAANRKVIVLMGEEHSTIAHVRMPELLRQSFNDAGIGNIAIGIEQQRNLLECYLSRYFTGNGKDEFRIGAVKALEALKEDDPARYRRLQALTHATRDWPEAPLTRLENFTDWLEAGVDVRLVDLPRIQKYDPETGESEGPSFVEAFKPDGSSAGYIVSTSPEALQRRNEGMAEELRKALKDRDVVIMPTGMSHLGGDRVAKRYEHSLHALFKEAARENITVIAVFQETGIIKFEAVLSSEAQEAMGAKGAVVLRGGNSAQNDQSFLVGNFALEAAALKVFAHASGKPQSAPRHADEDQYRERLQKNRDMLKKEIEDIIAVYAPGTPAIPGNTPFFNLSLEGP